MSHPYLLRQQISCEGPYWNWKPGTEGAGVQVSTSATFLMPVIFQSAGTEESGEKFLIRESALIEEAEGIGEAARTGEREKREE